MNLYKVHNLLSVHPILQVQANYELEGKYFTTLNHTYVHGITWWRKCLICVLLLKDIYVYSIKLYHPVEQVK